MSCHCQAPSSGAQPDVQPAAWGPDGLVHAIQAAKDPCVSTGYSELLSLHGRYVLKRVEGRGKVYGERGVRKAAAPFIADADGKEHAVLVKLGSRHHVAAYSSMQGQGGLTE